MLLLMLTDIKWLEEGPRKWGGIGTEWLKSALLAMLLCYLLGRSKIP